MYCVGKHGRNCQIQPLELSRGMHVQLCNLPPTERPKDQSSRPSTSSRGSLSLSIFDLENPALHLESVLATQVSQ